MYHNQLCTALYINTSVCHTAGLEYLIEYDVLNGKNGKCRYVCSLCNIEVIIISRNTGSAKIIEHMVELTHRLNYFVSHLCKLFCESFV